MTRKHAVAALMSAALLAASPAAQAQSGPPPGPPPAPRPVPLAQSFTVILQSAFGGPDAPSRRVISNTNDYSDFYKGNPPASPAIDFSTEVAVLVAMGKEPNFGYSVAVKKIAYFNGQVTVSYQETTPPSFPGVPVDRLITSPFVLVKFDRPSGVDDSAITFAAVKPPVTSFSSISLMEKSGWGFGHALSLDASGSVTVSNRTGAGGASAPWTDQSTRDELAAVNAALSGADLANLPATLPGIVADGTHFTLDTTTADGTAYEVGGFNGALGSYKDSVGPLLQALDAIATRIVNKHVPKLLSGKVGLDDDGNLTLSVFEPTRGTNVDYVLDPGNFADVLWLNLFDNVTVFATVDGKNASVQAILARNEAGAQVNVLADLAGGGQLLNGIPGNGSIKVNDVAYDDQGNLYYVVDATDASGKKQVGYVSADEVTVGTDAFAQPRVESNGLTSALDGH